MTTKLLLDLGNTRLKWALVSADNRWNADAAPHPDIPLLETRFAALPIPDEIHGCTVASNVVAQQLEMLCHSLWAKPIDWLQVSRDTLGVTNRYRQPEQQGPDRWAAMLGARSLYPNQALVVASAGTALTVDALTADSVFLGGMILPGYRLMKSSLAAGTARLPDTVGLFDDFPTSTEDAIETGILTALAHSIEAMLKRLIERGETPLLLLTGGDAEQIAPLLTTSPHFESDLVLRGLAALAYAKETDQ